MTTTLTEKLKQLSGGKLDLQKLPIVSPLTTGLEVNAPTDVIGLAVLERDAFFLLMTLENRDWESTVRWTGLTSSLYQAAITDIDHFKEFITKYPAMIAFAGGMTTRAFAALGITVPVLNIPTLVEAYRRLLQTPELDVEEEADAGIPAALKWLQANRPLRMMSRVDTAADIGVIFDDMDAAVPVVERNLRIDLATVNKVGGNPLTADS